MSDDLPTIAPHVSHSPEAEAASLPAGERPSGQDALGDGIQAGMSAIYDKHMERSEREAVRNPAMPPLHGENTVDNLVRASADWHEMPKTEQVRRAGADAELEFRRAEAKRYGITLEEYGQIEQTAALKNLPGPHEYQATIEPLRSIFPNQQPEATAKWMADLVKSARGNPREFVPWIAQQLGVDVGNLGPNVDHEALSAADSFFKENADARNIRKEMAEAIEGGQVTIDQPGDYKALFAKAYQHVKARKAKPRAEKSPTSFRDSMEAVYDQVVTR